MVILSVRSGVLGLSESALRIPVKVTGVGISAVVDTAAEIIILSYTVYDNMSPRPRVLSHVDVNLAWSGTTLSVGSLGPVQLGIGGDKVEHYVYIAPF